MSIGQSAGAYLAAKFAMKSEKANILGSIFIDSCGDYFYY